MGEKMQREGHKQRDEQRERWVELAVAAATPAEATPTPHLAPRRMAMDGEYVCVCVLACSCVVSRHEVTTQIRAQIMRAHYMWLGVHRAWV